MDGIIKPPVNRDKQELIEDRAERVIEEISKRERENASILGTKNNKKRVFRKRILVVFTVLLFCFIISYSFEKSPQFARPQHQRSGRNDLQPFGQRQRRRAEHLSAECNDEPLSAQYNCQNEQ